jgi:hypothetical protein
MEQSEYADWSNEELLELATRQKHLIWMVLMSLIAMFIPYATLITGAIQVYFIFKLAQALRSTRAWLYIILIFIPLVGLITLLYLNSEATKALRANHIKVGFMGARSSELEKLRASVHDLG